MMPEDLEAAVVVCTGLAVLGACVGTAVALYAIVKVLGLGLSALAVLT